jgi:hypothetical protein
MRKARHIDINNRLEVTRQMGLVQSFQIEWQSKRFCPPQVTVSGRPDYPAQVTKNYVAALLDTLVPAHAIVVTRGI